MKSSLLSALLLAGVLAAVHGQTNMCLQGQVQACVAQMKFADYTGTVTLDTFCKKLDNIDECFKTAQEMCNDDSGAEYLTDFVNVLRDICNPESELHRKFTKNSECLMKYPNTYLSQSNCLDELIKSAESLRYPTQEKITALSRKICLIFHEILDCVYRHIRRVCSAEAKDVVAAIFEPMSKMTRNNCKVAGFSVGGADTSALSWTLLAAASLLLILWQ